VIIDLDKLIRTWEHFHAENKKLSKGMDEIIVMTVVSLKELKDIKERK